MESTTKSTRAGIESLKPVFKDMSVAGGVAFGALGLAMRSMAKDGLKSAQIAESFERMTAQMGYSGDELIDKLREVSAGTVDTTNLMLASNKAMALGVGNDIETMTTLMEIARVKGRALGLDTTQAFNDIVTGIGRGSPLILDNLGIIIKLGEAQDMYAQQLGKTTAELTDNEKRGALLNAVLVSGRAELEQVGTVTLTSAERMQQLAAQVSDVKSSIGESLIPTLEKVVAIISPLVITFGEWVKENPKLASTTLLAATALAAMSLVLGTIGLIVPKVIYGFILVTAAMGAARVATLALLGPWGLVIAAAGAVAAVVGFKLWSANKAASESSNDLSQEAAKLSSELQASMPKADAFGSSLTSMGKDAKSAADDIQKLRDQMSSIFKDVAEDEKDSNQQLANAIVEQEEKVSGLRSEIRSLERQERDAENQDSRNNLDNRIEDLKASLAKEVEALASVKDMRLGLRAEIQEAERRADLSDFERTVEDIQKRRMERLKDQVAKLTELQAEITAATAKDKAIQASYLAAQENMREETKKTTDVVIEQTERQKNAIKDAFSSMGDFGTANSTAAYRGISKRASGGPVTASTPYMVGEQGPEMFVPRHSGSILPNGALAGVGSRSQNIVFNISGTFMDDRQAARRLSDEIMTSLRSNSLL